MPEQSHISIFGVGSWGTALALRLAENGHQVILWGRDKALLKDIVIHQQNPVYLPNYTLPANVRVQEDFASAVSAGEYLLLTVPAVAVRGLTQAIVAEVGESNKGLICTAKGLEKNSGLLMHEVIASEVGEALPTAYLSGPSFASEVAQHLPTAVVVTSDDMTFAAQVAQLFHDELFRVYLNKDVVGVEVSGAVKNVIAIAVGISDGLNFGANARAALITRGLSEMRRFALTLGADNETLFGLAGLGDLVLTCTDNQSRNRRFGQLLAQGKSKELAQREIGQVVEGVFTADIVCDVAAQKNIEMPICDHVRSVLHQGKNLDEAVNSLLKRDMKMED